MVTELSRTRSVRSAEVAPLLPTVPSAGCSTSELATLRRQRRPLRGVCAVRSNSRETTLAKPTGQLWATDTALSSRHSPVPMSVGRTTVRLQLPAALAGAPQVTGVGVGLGAGVGLDEGEGDGDGLAEGDGEGLGDAEGDAEGV